MKSDEIRAQFLRFFEDRSHRVVPSSPLIPQNDPTLLFANAGMNQFKDIFLGQEVRDYARACSSQKCVRAGGKHNDLEQVGRTRRHHTFFEMLGNFSFGPLGTGESDLPDSRRGYFKREIIAWAWELVTQVFGVSVDRLWVTIFSDDDEAAKFWHKDVGIPMARILRCGEEENFWTMGETGPCGPCSELHYDLGPEGSELGHDHCEFPCPHDCGRYMEIWNLVFMQFNRVKGGRLELLPSPSVDTGLGLERLATVLQGKISNFDTDLFSPLIEEAAVMAGLPYGSEHDKDVSLRILADHARAVAFLITDGVLPSNEGRGYVLRKILRRAIRHGRMIGLIDPFLYKLAGIVSYRMKGAYPELSEADQRMGRIVHGEELRFSNTLSVALQKLDDEIKRLARRDKTLKLSEKLDGSFVIKKPSGSQVESPVLDGAVAFKLYDTFGLPLDLLQDEGGMRGFDVDLEGFESELKQQRQRARKSWKAAVVSDAPKFWLQVQRSLGSTKFVGYEETEITGCVLMELYPKKGVRSETLLPNTEGEVLLDQSPFYAEGGGQVGDTGVLLDVDMQRVVAEVTGTYAPLPGVIVHQVKVFLPIQKAQVLSARVDSERRDRIRRNHTATHLLHAALRKRLGTHVKQAGSLVTPDRLRFDFSHYKRLEKEDLLDIEDNVNRNVFANYSVVISQMELESAVSSGAMALFGEKYSEEVRVVSIDGVSKELCGGTHVHRTGDIGLFKLISESSVAAGVRRIEALTGEGVAQCLRSAEDTLYRVAATLRTEPEGLVHAIERLVESEKKLRKELSLAKEQSFSVQSDDLAQNARTVKGVPVVSARVGMADSSAMRGFVDQLRSALPSGVVVLGSAANGKVVLLASVSQDLLTRLDAGKIVRKAAVIVEGGGGGRKDFAEAGGKHPERLDELIEAVYGIVEEML